MMSEVEEKLCTKCGNIKPRSDFYDRKWRGKVVGPETYCKSCVLADGKEYFRKSKAGWTRSITTEPGAIAVIDELRKLGIYAINGKASEFLHVDVVAWGCVRIEVKYCMVQDPKSGWHFKFAGKMKADIAILIPDFNGNRSFHIFDAKHPVLYRKSGEVKSSVAWDPNVTRPRSWGNTTYQSLTNDLMADRLNRWELIEQQRQKVIESLLQSVA